MCWCAQCDVVPNNDAKQTYACVYTPTIEGEYRVIIKFNGREIPRSPFAVKVFTPLILLVNEHLNTVNSELEMCS